MKLAELEPRWVGLMGWASPSPFYIGVTFLCPHCRTQRLAAIFDKPIDPEGLEGRVFAPLNLAAMFPQMLQWHRTGDTLETLTLTPSIDAGWAGHWHGSIANGEIR